MNLIKSANGSAKNLLKLIVDYFPAYRDEAVFLNRKGFLKKKIIFEKIFFFLNKFSYILQKSSDTYSRYLGLF